MNLKLVSKNNVGCVATLILVILLTQARVFDFLFDTYLGRTILIFSILGISYTNKILGVVAVLFLIIAFNQSPIRLGIMEGFTDPSGNSSDDIKTQMKNKIAQQMSSSSSSMGMSQKQTSGTEGFNLIERESFMLKGKKSNEIPVNRSQSNDVESSDKSIFKENYSTF